MHFNIYGLIALISEMVLYYDVISLKDRTGNFHSRSAWLPCFVYDGGGVVRRAWGLMRNVIIFNFDLIWITCYRLMPLQIIMATVKNICTVSVSYSEKVTLWTIIYLFS